MSECKGAYKVALSDASDLAGGILALANPEGVDLIVTKLVIDVTTVATAACSVDAGIAANGSTSADNLIDGQDVHTATGAFGSPTGSSGLPAKKWKSTEYLTVSTVAGGACAGLKGNAYIEYIRV